MIDWSYPFDHLSRRHNTHKNTPLQNLCIRFVKQTSKFIISLFRCCTLKRFLNYTNVLRRLNSACFKNNAYESMQFNNIV